MSVDQAFAHLIDPDALGRLVPMQIERVRGGDGPDPNGVGSVRRVSFHGLFPMEETMVEVAPPALIRYRIQPGGPLRDYQGVQRLAATATGSSVQWEITFRTFLPACDRLVARGLRLVARRALANLDRQVAP